MTNSSENRTRINTDERGFFHSSWWAANHANSLKNSVFRIPYSVFHLFILHPSSFILLILPPLYLATLAHTPILGDPTEYTFVANILGIAHPPGYAFITVVGKLFQTLIPFGAIPWRMHLLSAVSATLAALFVYGTVRTVFSVQCSVFSVQCSVFSNQWSADGVHPSSFILHPSIPALFAALTVGTAVDLWQHAIHANPHIITATFLAANLFFLTKWWAEEQGSRGAGEQSPSHPLTSAPQHPRWLYAFCLSAGLGVTHHPLTVFAFPAYALFILLVRPAILRDWRTMLKMIAFALLGLSLWLYFPIRSSMEPAFGPSTMNTLDGFLDYVLARGLSDSLPYFGWADQPNRALVFWTLLRLQYSLPVILLALWGLIFPLLDKVTRWQGDKVTKNAPAGNSITLSPPHPLTPSPPHLIILYALAFLGNYAFVISLKQQDVMAYLLGPFLVVGLLAGIGLGGLLALAQQRWRGARTVLFLLAGLLFLLGPGLQIAGNAPRISLRDYNEGQAYVDAVFTWFDGRHENAILLNDWEHMTPLWYTRYVEGKWPATADVQPQLVSTATANPWLDAVFNYLPGGPVYLSNYRREIVEGGFRLRPAGPFYQVVEPGDTSIAPELTRASAAAGDIEVVGYSLPETAVTAGDYVPLTIAMRAPGGSDDYYAPVLQVGDITLPFTTDSHLITPWWQPGEVIIERFDFALPHNLPGGRYPVTLRLKNLSRDQEMEMGLVLGQLEVTAQARPIRTDHLLANFRQRVGLVSGVVSGNGRRAAAPWNEPITAQPGDALHLTLKWQSLAPAEESYTVFIHLIDPANTPHVTLDYTPLGGATPTYLWIPKWLPGQQMLDPYRLPIPPDLPPGTYYIEVGLYEMVSKRRLHIADENGNLVGDRYILGSVVVENGD